MMPPPSLPFDSRIAAYCAPTGPEVFSGIVHGNQISTPDPFDVALIHADARGAFAKLLNRASSTEPPESGKILLLLGEGGSGKTHLMRAFWAAAHADGDGYCGYLQLATETDHYARYVLSKLLDSLERPYKHGHPETGLKRLAKNVLDAIDNISVEERQKLCDDLLEPAEVETLVHRLAYLAVQVPKFQGIDINVIRAILFTLANDTRIHAVVIQWLRCEDLSRRDRELLGDLVPRPQPEMPAKTIHTLGQLMHSVGGSAFVLLVDEMESAYDRQSNKDDPSAALRTAVNTLVEIADSVPNAVVVIGCIQTVFNAIKQQIPGTKLDRLLRDPDSILLGMFPAANEIEAMLALRLEAIFRAAGTEPDAGNPIAPFAKADIDGLAGFRSRDILDNLRKHREACMLSGNWVKPVWNTTTTQTTANSTPWPQRWNDHLATCKIAVLDDEPQLAELLAFAIRSVSDEVPVGHTFTANRDDRFVAVDVIGLGKTVDKLLVAVCNKGTKGGSLGNQIKQVAKKDGDISAILIRSTDFPNKPKLEVSKEIAKLVAPIGKGKRVVVADADWRALAAFRAFHTQHGKDASFAEWQRDDKPLSGLTAIRSILSLDTRPFHVPTVVVTPKPTPPPTVPPVTVPPTAVAPVVQNPVKTPAIKGTIHVGRTRAMTPAPVDMATNEFCRHAAFLGGSGSGKTTAALTIIEQLLIDGIPAVLIDRKGDLCGYADPDAWVIAEPDPARAAARKQFQDTVETVIYTPGSAKGRPLRISVVPSLVGLSSADATQMAQNAAAGLTQMLGYSQKSPDAKSVILQEAIEILGRSDTPVTVMGLQQLINNLDDSLTSATVGYDVKFFKRLSTDLLTMGHQNKRLLEVGDALDIDTLLGRGTNATHGRTRLTIINTQFIGDQAIDFWMSQFLLCLDRWRAKTPSKTLQAVFFFDEADKYLPAVGKPATKTPMEGLLKRARSAGIGIFLATQSPGDMDYKSRDQILTWLIGRVKEPTAIAKLKPMLDRKPDAVDKLAAQATGEFYLVRESGVNPIHVLRNLMPTAQLPEDRILELAATP